MIVLCFDLVSDVVVFVPHKVCVIVLCFDLVVDVSVCCCSQSA